MTYFSYLPNTTYEFDNTSFLAKDITKRSRFITELKPYTGLYSTYEITDGDTAQSLAKKFYGSVSLYWVILIFNELHNLYFEWPLDQITLANLVTEKYGSHTNSVRHYETNGLVVGEIKEFVSEETWISPDSPEPENINCIPKTFFEYEADLNDSHRSIKIMLPSLLADFIKQFGDSFDE